MRSSLCSVYFFTVIMAVPSMISGNQSRRNLLPSIETGDSVLSTKRRNNLEKILDYVRDSPEFLPLTLSIIFSESHTELLELLSKYVSVNSINAYAIRANDLSRKGMWKSRIDLTWIFFVEDLHGLNAFIYWQQEIWTSTNKYLIVFTNERVLMPWRKILENLWKRYHVFKILILSVRDDFRCLTRYLPFDVSRGTLGGLHKVCLNETFDGTVEDALLNGKNDSSEKEDIDGKYDMSKEVRLFENFENLRNHTMEVVVFASLMMNVTFEEPDRLKLSSLDANVVDLLQYAMKVNFHAKLLRKPYNSANDPFDRSLHFIETGSGEMIITAFFMKRYAEYHKYEFTSAIYQDKLCFIAPDSGVVPKSHMPFMPFQKELWILLLIYNVVITLIWFTVKYLSTSFRNRTKIIPLTFHPPLASRASPTKLISFKQRVHVVPPSQLSKSCLPSYASKVDKQPGNSCAPANSKQTSSKTNEPPRIPSVVLVCFDLLESSCYPLQGGDTASQKAFLFGTLFFGLIVTGLYQSFLVSSLSKPFHYPQLNTLEDVINSNKSLVTKYRNLKNTFADDTPLGNRLSEKLEVVNSSMPTNYLVAHRNVIALGRYASVKLENLTNYYDAEGNKLLHIVEECPATYMLSYVMRLHSPYRERINTILLRIQEAGLSELWYENMIYPLEVDEKRRKMARNEKRIRLTLEHYSLTFLLLFVGLFGCTVVFLGEVYAARRQRFLNESGRRDKSGSKRLRTFCGFEMKSKERR